MASTTRLLASEVRLVVGRRRNQAGVAVLALVPIMIAVTTRLAAPRRGGGGPDFFSQITSNGLFVAFAALAVELTMFLPMAVATLCGDSIAGEAKEGTLRYLLTVPVARTRLLLVKYASLVVSALIGVVIVAAVGALVGVAIFGAGPLTTLSGTQIGTADALWRLVLTCLYLTAGLAALAALGLFVSTLTEQPIAVIVTVLIATILFWLLDSIPQLAPIHPYLLVDAWPSYADLLRDPPYFANILRGLGVDAAYAAVFLLAAWARFSGKDVTS